MIEITLTRLGERIRLLRLKKNISQYDLAKRCNIEKGRMSKIESGQANPTLRTLLRISMALDVKLPQLFKDKKKQNL